MDYKNVVLSFIKDIVSDINKVEISVVEEEKDVTIFIYGDNENISRLIGKHGIIANSLREAINIAGKENNKFVHIHFEDKDKEDKDTKVEDTTPNQE